MSENDEKNEVWEEPAEEPTAEEPAAEEPMAEEPAGEEAVAEEPAPEEEIPVLELAEAKLDLNQASAEELASLPGIGPGLAGRIVAYREAEGDFKEAAEITNVNGISLAIYEGIADLVTVGEEGEADLIGGPDAPIVGGPDTPVIGGPDAPLVGGPDTSVIGGPDAPIVGGPDAPVIGGPDAPLVGEEDVGLGELPPAEEPPMPAKAEEPAMPAKVEGPPMPRPKVIVERGGPGWASLLILVLLGALAGAALALGALWAYNGTLDFRAASVRAARSEVARLEGQLDAVRVELTQTGRRMEALSGLAGRVDAAETEIATLGSNLETIQTDLQSAGQALEDVRRTLAGLSDDTTNLAEGLTGLGEDVATLESQIEVVGEELVALEKVAGRFDAFLEGLRGVLDETTAESPVRKPPTPTPWHTPTPTGAITPAPNVTVIPLATPTPSG